MKKKVITIFTFILFISSLIVVSSVYANTYQEYPAKLNISVSEDGSVVRIDVEFDEPTGHRVLIYKEDDEIDKTGPMVYWQSNADKGANTYAVIPGYDGANVQYNRRKEMLRADNVNDQALQDGIIDEDYLVYYGEYYLLPGKYYAVVKGPRQSPNTEDVYSEEVHFEVPENANIPGLEIPTASPEQNASTEITPTPTISGENTPETSIPTPVGTNHAGSSSASALNPEISNENDSDNNYTIYVLVGIIILVICGAVVIVSIKGKHTKEKG